VDFHVFIDLPNRQGRRFLPKINADAPDGFEWNYLFYAYGWIHTLYDGQDASDDHYGTVVTPTPTITVDIENKKIKFLFSPDALGNPTSLEGAKIYVTTWDSKGSDAEFRKITELGAEYEFGGSGDPGTPLIIDDTEVLIISSHK
jgi:hypothetical protein